jgi:N-acetyl-gamma-glutamyl-phosphate reductase
MLATVVAALPAGVTGEVVAAAYAARYAEHPSVRVLDSPPATAAVRGTARAHVHVAVDSKRGMVTAICAVDNLGKGAAGQAAQCMNLAFGLPEVMGLPTCAVWP